MDSSPQQFTAPELALVMPIYNEASNIASVVREWFDSVENIESDFVLFAINDGSRDETASVLKQLAVEFGPRLRLVNKSNSGHGRSCREGYELALAAGARWIFQIDSDGQCDPKFFKEFYAARSTYDCIFGYRRTRDDGLFRLMIARCYRLLLWIMTGAFMPDANVPYRLIRANRLRSALERIPAEIDLQNIALSISLKREPDLRWKDVPIHFRARRGGENSINCQKIAKMGLRFLGDFRRIAHEDSHPGRRPRWAWRRLAS
jgi:glycosyltransferase involved in cell wall biosynthesis